MKPSKKVHTLPTIVEESEEDLLLESDATISLRPPSTPEAPGDLNSRVRKWLEESAGSSHTTTATQFHGNEVLRNWLDQRKRDDFAQLEAPIPARLMPPPRNHHVTDPVRLMPPPRNNHVPVPARFPSPNTTNVMRRVFKLFKHVKD
jgi:hypothetical protein